MSNMAFKRALADVSREQHRDLSRKTKRSGGQNAIVDEVPPLEDRDIEASDSVPLSDEISALRVHKLSITLIPILNSSGGSCPKLTASRWEVRKTLLSLCSIQPVLLKIEVTDKSAAISASFTSGAAAEDLARKLRGVALKIKGMKLHTFVRCPGIVEASGATELNESRNLVVACLGPDVLESHNDREVAFTRLPPGHRPDTVVLRGIPANWVAQDGRPADATSAPGLERLMRRIGPVRAVEISPSAAPNSSPSSATPLNSGGKGSKSSMGSVSRGGSTSESGELDVQALLDSMLEPRALALGKPGGSSGMSKGRGVGGSNRNDGGVAAGLTVDGWIQFNSFQGFERALKIFTGRVLQKAGAELLCDYQLEIDIGGYMADDKRKERREIRARDVRETERRRIAIERAREQLVGLREGVQVLKDALKDDARPALQDSTRSIMEKATGCVDKAESLLSAYSVDEPAATAAIAHAKGEVAIARLSIRKAREVVDRAEEEERRRQETERDKELRQAAGSTLLQLQDTLTNALAMVEDHQDHPGIQPQAQKAKKLLETLSAACSKEGGSIELQGGEVLREARKATDTAITRACMLQRYLSAAGRFTMILSAAEVTLNANEGDANGSRKTSCKTSSVGGDDNDGSDGNRHQGNIQGASGEACKGSDLSPGVETGDDPPSIRTDISDDNPTESPTNGVPRLRSSDAADTACVEGTSLAIAYLDVAREALAAELRGLSEGDILLVSERAEEAMDAAREMLTTLESVNIMRFWLKTAEENMAGNPGLKFSEDIMRVMAAASISTRRAQREGFINTSGEVQVLKLQGECWKKAVRAAESDVKIAEKELWRVGEALRLKLKRKEERRVARKAKQERRLREAKARTLERQARDELRAKEQQRLKDAGIAIMNRRTKEIKAQAQTKAARTCLRSLYIAQYLTPARKRPRDDDSSNHRDRLGDIEAPAGMTDRWTLEEGLEVNGCESGAGNTVEDARDKEDPTTLSSMAGQRGLAFSPPRWLLTDGAAELEESGKVSIGAGEGLPPAEILDANGKRRHRKGRGSSIFGENGERDWLALVAAKVRSTIVRGTPGESSEVLDDNDALDGGKKTFADEASESDLHNDQERKEPLTTSSQEGECHGWEMSGGTGTTSEDVAGVTARAASATAQAHNSLAQARGYAGELAESDTGSESGGVRKGMKRKNVVGDIGREDLISRDREEDLRRRLLASMCGGRKKARQTPVPKSATTARAD